MRQVIEINTHTDESDIVDIGKGKTDLNVIQILETGGRFYRICLYNKPNIILISSLQSS